MAVSLGAYGVPQEEIALVLGIDRSTLAKYYAEEIAIAAAQANAKVAQSLFKKATDAACTSASVAAAQFWLRCRAGWRTEPPAGEATQPTGVMGKKAQAAVAAYSVGGPGSEWGDLLKPGGLGN